MGLFSNNGGLAEAVAEVDAQLWKARYMDVSDKLIKTVDAYSKFAETKEQEAAEFRAEISRLNQRIADLEGMLS